MTSETQRLPDNLHQLLALRARADDAKPYQQLATGPPQA